MIGRRLAFTPNKDAAGHQPAAPRAREPFKKIPSGSPLWQFGKNTHRTVSQLPHTYPIGLANRWKLNGKDFLIIVNGRAIGATVPEKIAPLRAVRVDCDFSAILRPVLGQIDGRRQFSLSHFG